MNCKYCSVPHSTGRSGDLTAVIEICMSILAVYCHADTKVNTANYLIEEPNRNCLAAAASRRLPNMYMYFN